MAKNTLIGINGAAKKANRIYVGVDGKAKKVKRGYIGVNGVAKLFYSGDPVLVYESIVTGLHSIQLSAGKYEITLIGGGGGAAGARSTVVNNHHYAQGGVGGTLQFIATLVADTTIQVSLGAGGTTNATTFSGASTSDIAGTPGGATTISGWANLNASAGGGTAAKIRPTSSSACNRTVGTIGTNSVSGLALREIVIDNPNPCTSSQSTSTGTTRTAVGRVNSNWPADTGRGKSGDHGWNNTTLIKMIGASGYVRIVMM